MTDYNFTRDASTLNYDIHIDPVALYGYFEHNEYGDYVGGGLWFERDGDVLELVDYDGVVALPDEVKEGLTVNRVVVPSDF